MPFKGAFGATLFGLFINIWPIESFAQTTADDVAKVITCMKAHSCKGVVFAKTYDQAVGEKIVFVSGGKRYTLYWNGDVDHYSRKAQPKVKQFLSVWIQPDGSNAPSAIASVHDDGLNGDVNFGIDGVMGTAKQSFDGSKGIEHRPYWQEQYDAAMKVALRELVE